MFQNVLYLLWEALLRVLNLEVQFFFFKTNFYFDRNLILRKHTAMYK